MSIREFNWHLFQEISIKVADVIGITNPQQLDEMIATAAMKSLQGLGVELVDEPLEFRTENDVIKVDIARINKWVRIWEPDVLGTPAAVLIRPSTIIGAVLSGVASVLGTPIVALQLGAIVGAAFSVFGSWSQSYYKLSDNEGWVAYALWSCLREADNDTVSQCELKIHLDLKMKLANTKGILQADFINSLRELKAKDIIKMDSADDNIKFKEIQIVSA